MRIRVQPWQFALVLVVLCVGGLATLHWRSQQPSGAAHLLAILPTENSTLVYLDVAALRESGMLDLLAGSKAAEESDYRKFVELTGFDYRTDLASVGVSFINGSSYFAVRGRFQWKQLAAYAASQGGECHYTVCTMPGSTPDRNISFYPVKPDLLALAVSPDLRAVVDIGGSKAPGTFPPEPVWVSVPSSVFGHPDSFPPGALAFLAPLAQTQRVIFAAGVHEQRLQLRLDVDCKTAEAAALLTKQLTSATELLKQTMAKDHQTPGPQDLSGLLVAGVFNQQGTRVSGLWPIERSFLEALASGQVR